jgi:cystathionine beta-lyase
MSGQLSLTTQLVHAGLAPFDPATGAAPVALPAMRTSTVRFKSQATLEEAYNKRESGERAPTYGRMGMDTHAALENVFAHLEGGIHAYLASSGLAAITLVFLALASAGDHVLVADSVYGPVRNLDEQLLKRQNIELTYFSADDSIEALVRPNTRFVYVESPGSLLFQMLDLPALSAVTRRLNVPLVVDNTWGAGYLYRPLALGADVSVVAGTKYVSGHSDLMLGAVITNDGALAKRINTTHYAMGYSISADDAWLALRGVCTLGVRLAQHAQNALAVCAFLNAQPQVRQLFHPAWHKDHGHALWRRDCLGSNGMLAVQLALKPAAARRFVDALKLFGIGFSWGGFESLVQYVAPDQLTPHTYWCKYALGDGALVRLHIGLESVEDVIIDLTQALAQATA